MEKLHACTVSWWPCWMMWLTGCADSPLGKVARYLFPFVLEYSLIALGAIAFILFNGIGTTHDMHGPKKVARGFKNLIRVFGDSIYMDKKNKEGSNSNSVGAFSFIFLPWLRRCVLCEKTGCLFTHGLSVWLAQLVKAPTLSQRACMFIRAWPCRRSEVQLPGQTAKTQASILSRSVNE